METPPSSWIDQQVQQIIDDLISGNPEDMNWDESVAWTFLRYAYGMGYMEGVHERL